LNIEADKAHIVRHPDPGFYLFRCRLTATAGPVLSKPYLCPESKLLMEGYRSITAPSNR
jgi:hypothetical protein